MSCRYVAVVRCISLEMFVSRQQLELLGDVSGNIIYFSEDETILVSDKYREDFRMEIETMHSTMISFLS